MYNEDEGGDFDGVDFPEIPEEVAEMMGELGAEGFDDGGDTFEDQDIFDGAPGGGFAGAVAIGAGIGAATGIGAPTVSIYPAAQATPVFAGGGFGARANLGPSVGAGFMSRTGDGSIEALINTGGLEALLNTLMQSKAAIVQLEATGRKAHKFACVAKLVIEPNRSGKGPAYFIKLAPIGEIKAEDGTVGAAAPQGIGVVGSVTQPVGIAPPQIPMGSYIPSAAQVQQNVQAAINPPTIPLIGARTIAMTQERRAEDVLGAAPAIHGDPMFAI